MTREYKVGMTGKTTKGYTWRIIGDLGTGFSPRPLVIEIAHQVLVDDRINRDGSGLLRHFMYGDLIHPDDAKKEAPDVGLDPEVIRLQKAFAAAASRPDLPIDPLRFQAACAALTGILANTDFLRGMAGALSGEQAPIIRGIANAAVAHGDAVLAKLTWTGDKTND